MTPKLVQPRARKWPRKIFAISRTALMVREAEDTEGTENPPTTESAIANPNDVSVSVTAAG